MQSCSYCRKLLISFFLIYCYYCINKTISNGMNHADILLMQHITTTCPYCGVGCALSLNVEDGRIVSVSPGPEPSVNQGALCSKGRFGFDFVHHKDRLTTPLIRKDGELVPASWEEALNLVATRFADIKSSHGSDALGGFSSARCTNEENYLFQKFFRAGIGTNNIDHCARL